MIFFECMAMFDSDRPAFRGHEVLSPRGSVNCWRSGICLLFLLAVFASPLARGEQGRSWSEYANAGPQDPVWQYAKARALASGRPRSLGDREFEDLRRELLVGSRANAYASLASRVRNSMGRRIEMDEEASRLDTKSGVARALLSLDVKKRVAAAGRAAQEAAFVALIDGTAPVRAEAKARMLALAQLDPRGASGVAQEDLSARYVTWTLALGLDWLAPYWSAEERALIMQAISTRMDDFSAKLVHGRSSLRKSPLNSHGNEVLGALAETAILLLGETLAAERWFNDFVPLYVQTTMTFGGEDGGYANGSNYAMADIGEFSVRHWDTLRRAAGIDLRNKPWAANFGRYMIYMLPPGTPVGSFGDGADAEKTEPWTHQAKVYYASRVRQPLYDWYARQWLLEEMSSLHYLLSPAADFGQATFPEGTPHAAAFTSVGVAALHSDLRDRGRASLYFRSSPFGSASHGHADQNSFVLNAGGMPLLLDSGYYDFFGSPHHLGWTKRTIAHNAVTFDGGMGQDNPALPRGDAQGKGKITQFSTSAELDILVGDATEAYRGQLTRASRGIVFIRPDTFVVIDWMESAAPRRWEWNLHSARRFDEMGRHRLRVVNGEAGVCIDFMADRQVSFDQHAGFPHSPVRAADKLRPDQWHGQFKVDSPSKRLMSVTVLRVGCMERSTQLPVFGSEDIRVRMDDFDIEFSGRKLVARKRSAK